MPVLARCSHPVTELALATSCQWHPRGKACINRRSGCAWRFHACKTGYVRHSLTDFAVNRERPLTEKEWLDCEVSKQNAYLMRLGDDRKLQQFYCACCRRAIGSLADEHRERISRMVNFSSPSPGLVVGDVWKVVDNAIEVAERFANGQATDSERKSAAEAADHLARHFGYIGACAPMPGEDPEYDGAAVIMGADLASAAECATVIAPSAAELSVRVVANAVSYDNKAYYAGSRGDTGIDPNHPHILARRTERAAQWKLLQQIFTSEQ